MVKLRTGRQTLRRRSAAARRRNCGRAGLPGGSDRRRAVSRETASASNKGSPLTSTRSGASSSMGNKRWLPRGFEGNCAKSGKTLTGAFTLNVAASWGGEGACGCGCWA